MEAVCYQIQKVVEEGHRVILSHGNGPQVGDIALQQAAASEVPENPLHVLDAMTQGEIGYIIQRELGNRMRSSGSKSADSLITQVVVSEEDPSFKDPSKPIGPFYSKADALRASREKGFVVKRVGRGGRPFRRVVPSPEPVRIVEAEAISDMVESGHIVIAGGGGGIPVKARRGGGYVGVDAVVDKDLSAEKLAESVGAQALLILTNVDQVKVAFGTSKERGIREMSVSEAKRHLAGGQFPPGTMGPKVTACVRFVERGGRFGAIGPISRALETLKGEAGTRIVPD